MDDAFDDEEEPSGPRPWPFWVSMALWGVPGREWAWGFFWLATVAAVACTIYGFVSWPFFAGGTLGFTAWWYHAAIRWVDRHGDWP